MLQIIGVDAQNPTHPSMRVGLSVMPRAFRVLARARIGVAPRGTAHLDPTLSLSLWRLSRRLRTPVLSRHPA